MDLNDSLAWQQVTCRDCHTTYQCTPENDYYGIDTDAPLPGPLDGVCFGCLLRRSNLDPDKTQVVVVDETGAELDPRDLVLP